MVAELDVATGVEPPLGPTHHAFLVRKALLERPLDSRRKIIPTHLPDDLVKQLPRSKRHLPLPPSWTKQEGNRECLRPLQALGSARGSSLLPRAVSGSDMPPTPVGTGTDPILPPGARHATWWEQFNGFGSWSDLKYNEERCPDASASIFFFFSLNGSHKTRISDPLPSQIPGENVGLHSTKLKF